MPTNSPSVVPPTYGGGFPITWQCTACMELIDETDLKATDWFADNREEEDPVCPYCNGEVERYEPDDFNGHETQEERKGYR